MEGIKALEYLGWFTSPSQTEPVHDPYKDGACLCIACDQPIGPPSGMRTASLMAADRPGVSFFYRIHKACDTDDEAADIKALTLLKTLMLE